MPGESSSERLTRVDEEVATSGSDVQGGVQTCPGHEEKVRVRIALREWSFELDKDAFYRLEVGDEVFQGDVPENGVIDHLVPESATTARLLVWPQKAQGVAPEELELELGKLEPAELEAGAVARLGNLLFEREDDEEEPDAAEVAAATEEFQDLFGLEPTGELDSATKEKLAAVYDDDEVELPEPEAWVPPPPSPTPSSTR